MSEGNHSIEKTTIKAQSGRPWVKYALGTLVLAGAGVIGTQMFAPHQAVSQTNGAGRASLNEPAGKILATVNNQAITYDVVARECFNRHGEEVLDTLINRLIIQQACQQKGISITAEQVQAEVAESAKKFNLPLDTWYQMLQAERGLTIEQYHNDVIWPMLALKKLAGQDMEVTEQEMQVGFERDYGERVKARMILIEGNHRQAGQIWEMCRTNPDDFDRIAMEHSSDPNSRPLGGTIPPIRKHGLDENVESAAFKLKTGEISGVIQVDQNRYVILKCEGRTEPIVTDIREVWNDLYKQLSEEKTQVAVAKVFEKIKAESRVDNLLTRTTTGRQQAPAIRQASGTVPQTPVQK